MHKPCIALPLLLAFVAGCVDREAAPAPATPDNATATTRPEPPAPPEPAAPTLSEPSAAPQKVVVAMPEAFRGRYARDAAACARPGEESRLSIDASRIAFHESSGSITAVTATRDEAAITAQLSGEGDTWERSYRFRLEDNGKAIVDVENGMRRVRCGDIE